MDKHLVSSQCLGSRCHGQGPSRRLGQETLTVEPLSRKDKATSQRAGTLFRLVIVELIRYKPGEAMRWLELGAQDLKKNASRQRKSVIRREGERSIGRDVRDVAGALMGMGKGAVADFLSRQAQASEYVLHEEFFEIITPGRIRSQARPSTASSRSIYRTLPERHPGLRLRRPRAGHRQAERLPCPKPGS